MYESADDRRKLRTKERKHYTDEWLSGVDEDEIEGKRTWNLEEKLTSNNYNSELLRYLKGDEFTVEYIQKNGFKEPIVLPERSGLGMRLPSHNFTVNDVRQCVGSRRVLDVMDVTTQRALEMTMREWCRYYDGGRRDRLLNVISLEFSHTKLEHYVQSPTVVRQIDWVDNAWPRHLKECQTESTNEISKMKYPKVQKYCLMSVSGCYTDFHIDFGGTSVWYTIIRGKKVFWLIPPTEKNLELYEAWLRSGKQGDMFFGDQVSECHRVLLEEGNSLMIPTAWIHAVYTPKDSLVFGGNFLHSFNIPAQLRVADIEDATKVPGKFRYPFYNEMGWYVLERYVHCLYGRTYLRQPDSSESKQLQENGRLADQEGNNTARSPNPRPHTPRSPHSAGGDAAGGGATCRSAAASLRAVQSPQPMPSHLTSREEDGKENVAAAAASTATEEAGEKPTYRHLTHWELEGLGMLTDRLAEMPASRRGVPTDLTDADALLQHVRLMLKEHADDDPKLAVTGKPIMQWPGTPKDKLKMAKTKPSGSSAASRPAAASAGAGGAPKAGGKAPRDGGSVRRRRTRCKKCEACLRADCADCSYCKDMRKFGGPGRMKQSCMSRQCMGPVLPNTALCIVCNLDGSTGHSEADQPDELTESTLRECSICWKIVHPSCLKMDSEAGIISDVLPNSWECPECCHAGKGGSSKPRQMKGIKELAATRGIDGLLYSPGGATATGLVSPDGYSAMAWKSPPAAVARREDMAEWRARKRKEEGLDLDPTTGMKKVKLEIVNSGGSLMPAACDGQAMESRLLTEKTLEVKVFRENLSEIDPKERARLEARDRARHAAAAKLDPADAEAESRWVGVDPRHRLALDARERAILSIEAARRRVSLDPPSAGFWTAIDPPGGSVSPRLEPGERPPRGGEAAARRRGLEPGERATRWEPEPGERATRWELEPGERRAGDGGAGLDAAVAAGGGAREEAEVAGGGGDGGGGGGRLEQPGERSKAASLRSSPRLSQKQLDRYGGSGDDARCSRRKAGSPARSEAGFSSSSAAAASRSPRAPRSPRPGSAPPQGTSPKMRRHQQGAPAERGASPLPRCAVKVEKIGLTAKEEPTDSEAPPGGAAAAAPVRRSPRKPRSTLDRGKYANCEIGLKRPFVVVRPAPPVAAAAAAASQQGALSCEIWLRVFAWLPHGDLTRCARVCRAWSRWCADGALWRHVDLRDRWLDRRHLAGVVRRQPAALGLSWTNVGRRQLAWMTARLPQLRALSLNGCSWAAVSALCSYTCPPLDSLELQWCEGVTDARALELVARPADSRPGFPETHTRLRGVATLRLTGCDVGTAGVAALAAEMPRLRRLDVSYCARVDAESLCRLAETPARRSLETLELASCTRVSNRAFEFLRRFEALRRVDLRDCPLVTTRACQRFAATCGLALVLTDDKLIVHEEQLQQQQQQQQ